MAVETDVYTKLAKLLGVERAPSFNKVLEIVITPQEAALVLELPTPTMPDQLAKKLKMDEKSLKPQLDELVRRGWLRTTKDGYIAPRMSPRFMPRVLLPGVSEEKRKQIYKDWYYQDYQRILVEQKEQRLATRGSNQWRLAPSGKALAESPNIRPEQLMPCEDVRDMVRRATDITVHACGCREGRANCDRPVETCLRVAWEGKVFTGDEHTHGHEGQTHISAERAIEIMDEAEESGLCHTLLNGAILEKNITICSCCPCCCYLLNPVIKAGKVHKLINPSRFRAVIDEALCQGCQTCVERCHFDAIEMRKVPGSKKMKAFIINENCLGCGVCMLKCPNKAMRMELVRPPEHIPAIPISQASSIPERLAEA